MRASPSPESLPRFRELSSRAPPHLQRPRWERAAQRVHRFLCPSKAISPCQAVVPWAGSQGSHQPNPSSRRQKDEETIGEKPLSLWGALGRRKEPVPPAVVGYPCGFLVTPVSRRGSLQDASDSTALVKPAEAMSSQSWRQDRLELRFLRGDGSAGAPCQLGLLPAAPSSPGEMQLAHRTLPC